MISLSATTYDPDGAIIVPGRISNPYEAERRGTVTATLDGGVSVYDGGYSIADQTLKCTLANPAKTLLESLRYLVAYYGQVITCCEIGAFLAVPSFVMSGNRLTLQLRLVSRLDS
jgi:hypothetical protein